MQNCQQTKLNYEPELWEFEYEIYRYLQNISDLELTKRYEAICRNFEVLTTEERNNIPINITQSSWYWYRKEHQTRYEFYLREKPISTLVKPKINSKSYKTPLRKLQRCFVMCIIILKYRRRILDTAIRCQLTSSWNEVLNKNKHNYLCL